MIICGNIAIDYPLNVYVYEELIERINCHLNENKNDVFQLEDCLWLLNILSKNPLKVYAKEVGLKQF